MRCPPYRVCLPAHATALGVWWYDVPWCRQGPSEEQGEAVGMHGVRPAAAPPCRPTGASLQPLSRALNQVRHALSSPPRPSSFKS